MNARDRILARVRLALDRASETAQSESAATVRDRLRNRPRGPLPAMNWDLVPRFRERCFSSSSTVDEIARLDQVPHAVARYLAGNALPSACVCWPELAPLEWTAAGLQVEARPATGDDSTGISGVFCAIAETGTLMLLSGAENYATTSLLPDTHIAVVPATRIVRSMEDAWDLLRSERGALPRQVTFVSGPSRTGDIEMTLVLGIHGPYRVHVIVVGG
ncbi:MAG TPA: lactate utilization protein C [Burkholderiales bacterium]|nr:lactate utilization protein C [Burkholderiales bacterium]